MDKLQGSAGIWEQVPPFKLTNQHHPATERHWHTSTSTSYSTEAFIASCRVEWAWAMGNGKWEMGVPRSIRINQFLWQNLKNMCANKWQRTMKWNGRGESAGSPCNSLGPEYHSSNTHTHRHKGHMQTQTSHGNARTHMLHIVGFGLRLFFEGEDSATPSVVTGNTHYWNLMNACDSFFYYSLNVKEVTYFLIIWVKLFLTSSF